MKRMEEFYETNIMGKVYGKGNKEMSLWLGPVGYGSPLRQEEKLRLAFDSLTGKMVELELLVESIMPNPPGRGADEVARFRVLAPMNNRKFEMIVRNPHKINVFR